MKIRTIAFVILVLFLFPAIGLAQDVTVYTVDMTEAHTVLVSGSPYVTKMPSGNSSLALGGTPAEIEDFVVGTTPGNTDPNYLYSPPHNIYAYKITDPCIAGPKTKVIIATGNHNTETSGNWAFQGMVDYILSADPNAQRLRQLAEFYIYPLVNPDGRYTEYRRGNPEMIAEGFGDDPDHNRFWNTQGQGLSTIDALTTAMQNDTGGDADYLFDFHSGGSNYFNTISDLMDCPFVLAFLALDIGVGPSASAGHPGMSRIWSMTPAPNGLSVEYAFTPEQDKEQTVNYYLGLGGYYALALHNTLNETDVTDYNDLKILADNWLTDNLVEQTAELVGFWQLDEPGGTAAPDSSGNGHNGTLNNGPLWQSSGGRFGGALSFDEVDDYLEIPDFSYTNAADEFTLCFWFKIDDVAGSLYQYMFSHGNFDTNNSLNVYLRESSATSPEQITTNIKLNDATKWQPNTGIALADGQWHMYAITVSSADGAEIFIDANSIDTDSAVKGSSFNPGTNIHLGSRCDYNIDRYFGNPAADDGLLDDVRIYNYPLSSDDIELLYGGSDPCEPQPWIICTGNPPGDLNDDCKVNSLDYALLANNWYKVSP